MSAGFVFRSSMAYLTITVVDRVVGLLLTPAITRALTPRDYAVMLLVTNGGVLFNLLFGYGVAQAIPTVFSNTTSDTERRATCTTVMLTVAVLLGLAYLVLAAFAGTVSQFFLGNRDYTTAIALGAATSLFGNLSICLLLLLRLAERHRLYLVVQLPALALQYGLIVALVATHALSVPSLYVVTTLNGIIVVTAYAVAMRHWLAGPLEMRRVTLAGRIGAQMLPWQIAMFLTVNSAAFFLTRGGHVEEAGLFALANSAAALLMVLSNSFEFAWTPFVLLRKDQPDLSQIQARILSLYAAGLLVAAAGLSLFAQELFVVLVGPAFRTGYRFVPALAFAYVLFGFATCFAQALQARQRTGHYVWIGGAASAVYLAIALTMTKGYGAYGIIAAMAAGFAVMLVLIQVVSAKLMPVRYPWVRLAAMWLVGVAIVVPVYPLPLGWDTVAIKLAAFAVIAALPLAFRFVSWADLNLAKAALLPASR